MKRLFFTNIVVLFYFGLFAQVPQSFQYQSVVRDAAGTALVNQPVNFQISIISGSITGTVVYSETHTASTNAYGIVTLNIGGGTPVTGTFSVINWGSTSHYIKVEADPAGGTNYLDMGTTQLLSVPYALYSENTGNAGDTLWGINGSNIYNKNDGNVGVGINNPAGRMVIQGDVNALATDPLFEVKNAAGQSVFVVYQDSVNVFVNDDLIQSNRGGFAVSGRNNAKAITNKYLYVTPDNSKIWTKDTLKGFGVENINGSNTASYMQMTPDNYFIGHQAGNSITTGKYNSFIGYQSGFNDTSGFKNYFIGYKSGYNNFSGYSNIFLGDNSGYSNATGYSNIFLGDNSGYFNSSGKQNVFLGYYAGYSNNADYNVFLGCRAGYSNTTGWGNTANGFYALYSNTGGLHNVANGYEALYLNTTGNLNVANGYQALFHNNANWNVANGYQALYNNTTGDYNTAVGFMSMISNVDGYQNVAIGPSALYYNTNGNENVAIGVGALEHNNTGDRNVAVGSTSLYYNYGLYNTAVGYSAFTTFSPTYYSNSTAIGNQASIFADNQVRIGNSNVTSAWVQVNWSIGSDVRIKNNVKENVPGLDFIKLLRPVTYNYNITKENEILGITDSSNLKSKFDIEKIEFSGFIAQEVDEAAKKANYNFSGVDKKGPLWGLRYSEFTVPLVKAVQELDEKNKELLKIIEQQQIVNTELQKRIEALENKIK